jgi:predicted ATP-grasp superfamily ATP-dependent carboligase
MAEKNKIVKTQDGVPMSIKYVIKQATPIKIEAKKPTTNTPNTKLSKNFIKKLMPSPHS